MSNLVKTNIPWMPYLKSDWKVLRVKNAFYASKEKAHQETPTILSLARSGVKIRDISNNEGQLAESYYDYNPVRPGDLLLNPMDLYSGANCNVSEVEGVISPAYANLRAKVDLNPFYFDYYFKTQYWTMAMFAHGKGVSFDNRWTLNNETLMNYEIPFPPYEKQLKIVEVLKNKIDKIDELIRIEKEQVDKLNSYKNTMIVETIKFGVDDNLEIKDSGVEWIGKINKRFELVRMRFLVDIATGDHDTQDSNPEGEYPLYVRSPIIEKSKNYTFEGEGILMAGDGAGAGRVFHHVFGKYAVHQRVYRFYNFKRVLGKYLHYYLSTMFYKIMEYGSAQTTVPSVRLPMIQNFEVIVTSLDTQRKIVEYLDGKCDEIDRLIKIKQGKIEKLQEYKKSLIYEVVTGKKEV